MCIFPIHNPFLSLQTFQQKVIAKRSTWTVAHFADSWSFPDGALLPNIALIWKQSVSVREIIVSVLLLANVNGKCVILI